MPSSVRTSLLFLSDTHGRSFPEGFSVDQPVDVVVQSGDLTDGSTLDEFRTTLALLKSINAPLKLVIAGNHDFTRDIPAFERKLADATPALEPELVKEHYGAFGEAHALFDDLDSGIVFLDEGHHSFTLTNGAKLSVYVTPYTPSYGAWGFQYRPEVGRTFDIQKGVDVVISHGPPRGVMDRTAGGERAGCPDLFAAVARARPRIHCFGHIHEGWGAKDVSWRPQISATPSHFADIDNEQSHVVETLATLRGKQSDEQMEQSEERQGVVKYDIAAPNCRRLDQRQRTLFINASLQGPDGRLTQKPWLVDLLLDAAL